MPKKLPEDWINGDRKSLDVLIDLGLKDCPRPSLFIYRNTALNTKNLLCRWLPKKEEDHRVHKGKKRLPYYSSTGFEDPYDAGKFAIGWLKEKLLQIEKEKEAERYNSETSYHHYWKVFWEDQCRELEGKRGDKKKLSDLRLKWEGEGYGLMHQKFSNKSVEETNFKDLKEYFQLLQKRGEEKGNDMAGTKKQQKTLINKLRAEARTTDFPSLPELVFPEIVRAKKSAPEWLIKSEWNLLNEFVLEQTKGVGDTDLSQEEYLNLEWTKRNRKNQRNWVDFYDALMTQWYFYIRAEDMPRLRMEWFREEKYECETTKKEKSRAVLYMREVKGDRQQDDSYSFRETSLEHIRRMFMRRGAQGWCWFDFYNRPANNPADSQVLETLNFLLQFALKETGIADQKRKKLTWTSIRHTAFYLTVQEYPELRDRTKLSSFADNGFTSVKMLDNTYLKKLEAEKTANEARTRLARRRGVPFPTFAPKVKKQMKELEDKGLI